MKKMIVFAAAQIGLNLTCPQTQKACFLATVPHLESMYFDIVMEVNILFADSNVIKTVSGQQNWGKNNLEIKHLLFCLFTEQYVCKI